jgi:hypothetical protein
MDEQSECTSFCDQCGGRVEPDSDFCVHCGIIFAEQIHCRTHPQNEAEGVCLICRIPFCGECGTTVNAVFLCQEHSTLRIVEGGASVFNSTDLPLAQIASQVLTESGYHPFFVTRTTVPVTNIGRLTRNTRVGPHMVIVPFDEFLAANEVLKKLDILA